MSIRQTLRERPRLRSLGVAIFALCLVAVALVVLKGGGGDRPADTVAADLAEAAALERQATTTTARPTTTGAPTTVPPALDFGEDDDPRAEVTTTQPPLAEDSEDAEDDSEEDGSEDDGNEDDEDTRSGGARIIRELTERVKVRTAPSMTAPVVRELGIGAPVTILERVDGWYRIRNQDKPAWVFGAYVVPPVEEFEAFISVDGSNLRPQYASGELVPDLYEPGKYAFGYEKTDGDRTLVFLPSGLVVYVDSARIRPVN